MKKTLPLFYSLFIASVVGFAQTDWVPSGADWYYAYYYFADIGFVHIEHTSDSTIEGENCKILMQNRFAYNQSNGTTRTENLGDIYTFSRNDSAFYYNDGQFYLLYDFSANPGDTWAIGPSNLGPPGDPYARVKVDSIGIIMINGMTLRWVSTSPVNGSPLKYDGKIVERIGSIEGFLLPESTVPDAHEGGPFRCYYDDVFGWHQSKNGLACDTLVGMKNTENISSVQFSPNPAISEINLTIPGPAGSYELEFYSALGKMVKAVHLNKNNSTIDISNLSKGIYTVLLRGRGDKIGTSKLIKED